MKDYTYLKSQIQYSPVREAELDALLADPELMPTLERMCIKSNVKLPSYIQFLMEKEPDRDLHDLARQVVAFARRTRPDMC